MKNCDIITAVFEHDKSHNLLSQVNSYATMLHQGYSNFRGLETVKVLYEVLRKLEDENYQITERDAQILRSYNVSINPKNSNNKSFVVTSDFHGYNYPLDIIKSHYLNEYDVIYILGDATDRGIDKNGTGSIKLLLDIMKLTRQYPNRVVYVPGNHDEFLLGYMIKKQNMDPYYSDNYTANLMYNGGESTIKELNELEKTDPKTYSELMSWLGMLPLQKIHKYNGKTYVLGHAIFNQGLYDINPNYCLNDYFKEPANSNTRRMAQQVLWFRKDQDRYSPREMPSADKIMVIGHTRAKQTRGKNLNLYDKEENIIKVHCVDGGIAYEGGMLKYDGGASVAWVKPMPYNSTPNYTPSNQKSNSEAIYQNYILGLVLKEGNLGIRKALAGYYPKEIGYEEAKRIVCEKFHYAQGADINLMRNLYVKTYLFNYILESQFERLQERYQENTMLVVSISVDSFLHGSKDPAYIQRNGTGQGDYYNFTSHRNAREVAMAMGPRAMEEVLTVHGCKTVDAYVIRKFSNDSKGKSFAKVGTLYS